MKNLRTSFVLSLIIALYVACSGKSIEDQSQMDQETNHEMNETSPNESANITSIAFKEESTTTIFNAYLAVKDALVATDGKKVKVEAMKLDAILVGEKYNSIKVDVQKIAESTDISNQRKSFVSLSDQVIELAKNSELTSGNLFLQNCPMANENKGANWLSLTEEIRNPYYGDKMLKCGKITEKI